MGKPTICVIGQFEIFAEAGPVQLAGELQRTLLALLASSHGRWVPAGVLSEALWPGAPPGAAASRLHVHVHRLRGRLGAGCIEAGPDGYRLHLHPEAVDVWRFDRLASGTLAAHSDGTHETELLTRLDEAAAAWCGEPYPGVDHPLVDAERHRLTELYLLVEETRAQHRLDRGEHHELLEHLVRASCAHPTRERLHTLRMTALFRLGEHAQAAEVYTAARDTLATELGAVPGPALEAIHSLVAEDAGDEPPGGAGCAEEHLLRDRLAAARCAEERAMVQRQLGMLLGATGHLEESLELLFRAEAQYRLHGPLRSHRAVLQQLAMEMSKVGDLRRALRLLEEAQQTYPGAQPSDRLRIVRAIVLTHMKDADGALALLEDGRRPNAANNPLLAGMWWRAHSIVVRLHQQHEEAVSFAREALRLAQRADAATLQSVVMVDLACALRDAGQDEAHRWYRRAVRLGHQQGRPPLVALAEGSAAKAALLDGDPDRATVHAREALRHARQAGAWGLAGRASSRLAEAADQLGETMRASWYRQESLSQYRRVDFPLSTSSRCDRGLRPPHNLPGILAR